MRAALLAALLLCTTAAQASDLDRLIAAYPDTLSGRAGNAIVFRNGTRLDAGTAEPGKPFADLLNHATIADMFRLAYPTGAQPPPAPDFDPGRFRSKAFFDRMYGDCRKGEVEPNLVSLDWLPQSWGHTVRATRINGVADRLKQVSAEIEALPPAIRAAAFPIAGIYACRGVADAGQPSMHAYGAAIDLNLKVSNYWLWTAGKDARTIPYVNRMPQAIVDVFERHGFIWGGKWYHYDTMHFEYRPELMGLAAGGGGR